MGPGKLSNVMFRSLTFNTQAHFPILHTIEPIELAEERLYFSEQGTVDFCSFVFGLPPMETQKRLARTMESTSERPDARQTHTKVSLTDLCSC